MGIDNEIVSQRTCFAAANGVDFRLWQTGSANPLTIATFVNARWQWNSSRVRRCKVPGCACAYNAMSATDAV